MKILLFSGWMKAGKNYFADKIKERLITPIHFYFAYQLKKWVADLFKISIEELDELKDVDVSLNFYCKNKTKVIVIESFIRRVMRWLGTEVVRTIKPTYWADQVMGQINKQQRIETFREGQIYCITDWRFKNECERMLEDYNEKCVIKIRIECNDVENKKYKSEMELNNYPVDILIDNVKGDKELLEKNIQKIIDYIGVNK